ncbi:MAG: MmcB family DNA repair protein [Sphingomonadaceae bacterium]|nr:MmcB family DNA repair protein [Sphingomonadaceae bacterium]
MATADVVRGTARLLLRHDCLTVTEVPLGNGRRADLMGLCPNGRVTIVEVKVSRADLLGDAKWTEYLDYCDRFFWAIPAHLDASLLDRVEMLPARAGLIVADRYDAAIVREPAIIALAPSRRRAETLRVARRAARRLLGDLDDGVLSAT